MASHLFADPAQSGTESQQVNQPSNRRAIMLSIFIFSVSAILIDQYYNKYRKPRNDYKNVFLTPKNIGKLVLLKVVRLIWAEILPFQFPVAAILDFVDNGR